MDYSQILPNLFVGSHPDDADDVEALKGAGITAVLNLQSEDDFEYLGIGWSRLHACYFAAGIEVRRVPVQDFDDDDLRNKLPEAVQALKELLDHGHTVFVHCSAGVNRSPSTVICYLHWEQGSDLDEAVKQVRTCRNCSPVMEVIQLATRDRKQSDR
jgi:protein-tyrosine phosphatase